MDLAKRSQSLGARACTTGQDDERWHRWDSFRQVEIVMAAQEVFNMQFSTRELDSMGNVGDLVRVIAVKSGKT